MELLITALASSFVYYVCLLLTEADIERVTRGGGGGGGGGDGVRRTIIVFQSTLVYKKS